MYVELVAEHFVISYKESGTATWQKLYKDVEKLMVSLQEESQTV